MEKVEKKTDLIKEEDLTKNDKRLLNDMEKHKKGKYKKFFNMLLTWTVAIACLFVGGFLAAKAYSMYLESQGRLRMVEDLKKTVTALNSEKRELKERLAMVKTREGLARRDLEAYILKKYPTVPKVLAKEIAIQTAQLTKEYSVPFPLIVGIMEVESGFKPWLVSKVGARGLLQVMPEWVKKGKNGKNKLDMDIDKNDLHDVEANLTAGIKVFKIHLKENHNNINKALYYYVGRDKKYAGMVFSAMGKFVTFRSTLDTTLNDEEKEEDEAKAPEAKEPIKILPPVGCEKRTDHYC
ncbi:MAG: lytic transglycosylase domain-containing protein [Desulfobacteraceae bacterium]|jgi:hypothetical protein